MLKGRIIIAYSVAARALDDVSQPTAGVYFLGLHTKVARAGSSSGQKSSFQSVSTRAATVFGAHSSCAAFCTVVARAGEQVVADRDPRSRILDAGPGCCG